MELSGTPYVGSGVMGSSAGMDKDVAKRLLRDAGIPVVPFVTLTVPGQVGYDAASAQLGTGDLFVKPANMGSSVGVSPARSADAYAKACALAFRYDTKVLVERSVAGAREIECSVLEDASGEVRASPLGEIVPAESHGFYSYDAKYVDDAGAALRVPADLPPALAERTGRWPWSPSGLSAAAASPRRLLPRPADGTTLYLNEVNTLPGFTSISMYPKLWEAGGLAQTALMDVRVGHALCAPRAPRGAHGGVGRRGFGGGSCRAPGGAGQPELRTASR
jgi:D-alanine-D-alanine ligase